MSGPKSSDYTLTAEQRMRIIAEQERIRKELERKAQEKRESVEAAEFLRDTWKRVLIRSRYLLEYQNDIGSDADDNIRSLFAAYYKKLDDLEDVCKATNSGEHKKLMSARKNAERLTEELAKIYDKTAVSVRDRIHKINAEYDSKAAESMNVSFENFGVIQPVADIEKTELLKALDELSLLDISEALRGELERVRRNLEELNGDIGNFRAVAYEPLRKKCVRYISFSSEHGEEYCELRDRYKALCEYHSIAPVEFEFDDMGLSALRRTIAELEADMDKDAEKIYIRSCIDEIMSEMGYKVLGERHVVKRSGKKFSSRILSYMDGAVVNVTESSDGQITMEIGGIDNKDRLPVPNERAAQRKLMDSFCTDFSEIENKLMKRGVILNSRISMLPPDEAYAQIINYTDYELNDDGASEFTKHKNTAEAAKKKYVGE